MFPRLAFLMNPIVIFQAQQKTSLNGGFVQQATPKPATEINQGELKARKSAPQTKTTEAHTDCVDSATGFRNGQPVMVGVYGGQISP